MPQRIISLFIFAGIFIISCTGSSTKQKQAVKKTIPETGVASKQDSIVYETKNLIITRLSDHVYQHISFLKTNDYGLVECNGMIVLNENEAIIFDTPADNESSGELINYLTKEHNYKIDWIIPTHFHEDCVGGLEKFNENNIPSYASNKTIALLKKKGKVFSKPIRGFDDSLTLNIGDKKVYIKYFGEGHTRDNIVGYFPDDKAVFGGCLIKEVGATKGNLADANVAVWPETVRKLKQSYPQTRIVIPGHGKTGGIELFDYTIKLFE
jgi:metallo-beta-lactamase class B